MGVSGIVGSLIVLTRELPFEGECGFRKPFVECVGVLLLIGFCLDFLRPKRPIVVVLLGGVTGVMLVSCRLWRRGGFLVG